ncbi:MAG: DUF4412 domain-containing protein [Bacteroidales bacterium]|nr:DUF4412 domain-containing protein [Bacteroidales bacterium]MCF8398544.1 DUF4412 domain-containing protein [Bacteroidales bacterium]
MRKLIRFLSILIIISIAFSSQSMAGKKPFRGIITYKISYPESEFDAQTMSMLPKVAIVMIKGDMLKTSITTGAGEQTMITDGKNKTNITLIDAMGQKFALRSSFEENEEEMNKYETTVEETGKTKEIAGYDCEKVIIHLKNKETQDENDITVYYTDKFDVGNIYSDKAMFEKIDGLMLQYELNTQGMKMVFTATDVKKKKVSDDEFVIPEGYEETTREELQRNFGG